MKVMLLKQTNKKKRVRVEQERDKEFVITGRGQRVTAETTTLQTWPSRGRDVDGWMERWMGEW